MTMKVFTFGKPSAAQWLWSGVNKGCSVVFTPMRHIIVVHQGDIAPRFGKKKEIIKMALKIKHMKGMAIEHETNS